MSSLFQLTGKYAEVKELAEQGVDEQVIIDTLESIEDEIEVKADGYAAVIKQLKGNVATIDEEIARLQKVKATHINAEKRMKENLKESMLTLEKLKFQTSTHTFYIKKNPVKMIVDKDAVIPEKFYVTKKEVDKPTLKEYLQSLGDKHDDTIKGARLEQGESLVIK